MQLSPSPAASEATNLYLSWGSKMPCSQECKQQLPWLPGARTTHLLVTWQESICQLEDSGCLVLPPHPCRMHQMSDIRTSQPSNIVWAHKCCALLFKALFNPSCPTLNTWSQGRFLEVSRIVFLLQKDFRCFCAVEADFHTVMQFSWVLVGKLQLLRTRSKKYHVRGMKWTRQSTKRQYKELLA